MNERDMEDLIAKYPDDFFPTRGFKLKGRQQVFAEVGRFGLLFEDHFNTKILNCTTQPMAASCSTRSSSRF
jgi:hypothetical protein